MIFKYLFIFFLKEIYLKEIGLNIYYLAFYETINQQQKLLFNPITCPVMIFSKKSNLMKLNILKNNQDFSIYNL